MICSSVYLLFFMSAILHGLTDFSTFNWYGWSGAGHGAGCINPSTAAVLILNAHSAFRAGIRMALSGQLLPVFMTLRGSIESVLYANAMVVNRDLESIWIDRDHDERARANCRSEFTIGKAFQYLSKAQDRQFSEALQEAYQSTIDFGAHPNSRSLLKSVRIDEIENGKHLLNFAYVHGVGSFELRQSLVACAEVGIMVFLVALICSPKHPGLEELNQRAIDLQGRGIQFVRDLGLNVDPPST